MKINLEEIASRFEAAEKRLDKAERRLDKHAETIRELRERVHTLEGRHHHPAGSGVSVRQVEPIALPSTCLRCGNDKGDKRDIMMTCKPCAEARRAGIKAGGAAREAIILGHCGICQRGLGRSTALVCGTCRPGVTAWTNQMKAQWRAEREAAAQD